MIEFNIHYCWFGGSPLPEELQRYVDEWKDLYSDYEFYCWNEDTFDINSSLPFVREAYANKKYAFVADYVRMWAIYNYGGIYMDTDIKLLKRFDELMHYRFFTAMEYHEDNVRILNIKNRLTQEGYKKDVNDIIYDICIESSFFAAQKNHPFIKDCLDYYQDKKFVMPDGSFYDKIILPIIMAIKAEKYGFRYKNEFQKLDEEMFLLPDEYITHPSKQTSHTIALHMVKNSWKSYTIWQRLYAFLAQNWIVKNVYDLLKRQSWIQRYFDHIQKIVWLNGRR